MRVHRPILAGALAGAFVFFVVALLSLLLRPAASSLSNTVQISGIVNQIGGGRSSIASSVNGQPLSCSVGVAKWTASCSFLKAGQTIDATLSSMPTIFGAKARVIRAVVDGRLVYAPSSDEVIDHWQSTSIWDAAFLASLTGFAVFCLQSVANRKNPHSKV